MGGVLQYYKKQPILSIWQRLALGFAFAAVAITCGTYVDGLVQKRYSSFRGRTSIYGDSTVRNGWLNAQSSEVSK